MMTKGCLNTSEYFRPEDWVIGKTIKIFNPPHYFKPERGGLLGPVEVAYETYGSLNEKGDNALLIAHALTGSARAHGQGGPKAGPTGEPGWWKELIGPGKAFDTEKYLIVCINVLGSCYGTTGPSSLNPENGRHYGTNFPVITIKDMVKIQREALKFLGVKKLKAVVGGSLGGQQALQWGVTYPDFAGGIIAIGCTGSFSPQGIALNHVTRRSIMQDPDWCGGDYYGRTFPAQGLALARLAATITYKSPISFEKRFSRQVQEGKEKHGRLDDLYGDFAVENYLDYQGDKFLKRFDPNSYLYLIRAMDLFDLGSGYPSFKDALRRIQVPVRLMGISSDILFPPEEVRGFAVDLRRSGVDAVYEELDSPLGHDAFLIEFKKMSPFILDFLNDCHCK